MNSLDKLLGTYTGIMTVILSIGALMTVTKSSPLLLLAIFPLTGYMIVQGVRALYGLKYGPKPRRQIGESSVLTKLKQKQANRSSLTTKAALHRFFAQNGKGFLVTLALLTITITSLIVKRQLSQNQFISPIPQQQMITFNVR